LERQIVGSVYQTGELVVSFASRAITRWLIILILVVVATVGLGAGLFATRPFTSTAAAKSLGEAFGSKTEFGTFRQTWFPRPGYDAKDVILIPEKGRNFGLARVAHLRVQATWLGLLQHHVRVLTADGITVRLRSLGEGAFAGHAGTSVIEQAELRNAVLQIGPGEREQFKFGDVDLKNVGHGRQVTFRIAVAIPRPAGDLELRGKLGPLEPGQLPAVPLEGSYTLNHADLRVFNGIAGMVSSKGTYSGELRRLLFHGETDVPQFSVTESGHVHHLNARFDGVVNGTNGDTSLDELRAAIDGTVLESASARVESAAAKLVSFDIRSARGRIQDLMLLFVKAPQSPILGPVRFRAHIALPPGPRPFKERVALAGDFGISGAGFSKPATQARADELSMRAEGQPRETRERVLSDLTGHVELRNGVATFSNLSFHVPGATANLSGTFDIVSERIDLQGKLATQAELSQMKTGISSVFLKLLNPVFKRRRAGAVVPVSITGTYADPQFREVMTK
jgi:hypothetical protein